MATALQGLRLTARTCTCREVTSHYAAKPIGKRRALSTTPIRFRDPFAKARQALNHDPKEALDNSFMPKTEEIGRIERDQIVDEIDSKIGRRHPPLVLPVQRKKLKQTFMNLGDPEPWEDEDTLDDDHDDMPSLAHGELEQHREMRHYARLAAWEMPLLAKLAKPFVPPTKAQPLRFRYTTYMGEQHPAEKKVVLEFCPGDMPDLKPVQVEKLKKLVGSRYNPQKDIIKMSCEMFETQAQNKRYLGDLVEDLLHESRTGDTFEDVPLDLRHHRVKAKPKFPKEWVVNEERKAALEKYRQEMQVLDQQKELAGHLVDGVQAIETELASRVVKPTALPEMAMAGKGSGGRRVAVRRN